MIRVLITLVALAFVSVAPGPSTARAATAILAGGCFWCVESDFDHVAGVSRTISGYTGGSTAAPTYQTYAAGRHIEAVKITYDPGVVSYRALLDIFWRTVNPTDAGGQFCDRGASYRTAVFVANAEQRAIAEASRAAAEKALGRRIVTEILPAGRFWAAELYHQDYAEKNPIRYRYYRTSCGRDRTVRRLWGSEAYRGVDK